jgi:hypothetical protein
MYSTKFHTASSAAPHILSWDAVTEPRTLLTSVVGILVRTLIRGSVPLTYGSGFGSGSGSGSCFFVTGGQDANRKKLVFFQSFFV